MLEYLFILPLGMGLITLFLPAVVGRFALVATGLVHLFLSLGFLLDQGRALYPEYFTRAYPGMLMLLLCSFVFACTAPYAAGYMRQKPVKYEPVFSGCMLLFLGTMSMAALAEHPIVFWIAIEATTLASAPLIFIHRSKQALEATWKYVLICSVGIALALLGLFFITFSMEGAGLDIPLTFTSLNTIAAQLNPLWLKTGFIFVLIGFGTKMGLAPMHTWLPDAHSEAPSPASALLSGALLNCAFLGIYKVHTLMVLAGLGQFSSNLLIGFGLFSLLVAGVFILNQPDYKRMLAYSSIENMGIIAIGTGIGGLGLFGAMLHLIHHSLLKSSLFLSAGTIMRAYGSKLISQCTNMPRLLPKTFCCYFAGCLGIAGLPPFGLFLSEMLILFAAFQQGLPLIGLLFAALLILVIAGFIKRVLSMSLGERDNIEGRSRDAARAKERLLQVLPPLVLLSCSLLLCLWIPEPLRQVINDSIVLLGGRIYG
ncbi:MAG: proton-conducting transporter membrane subunit [bacterium]|nr:proton-conducting transporter membrane subunit [bacterium]